MIVCYRSSRLALLPPPFFPTLLRILLIIPSAKDGGGVIGETRRVQVSTFNSSVMLSRPEFFFLFLNCRCFFVAYIMAGVRLKRILRGGL